MAPIVEGHGEVSAARILLQRIGLELLGGIAIEVLPPIRQPRQKLGRNLSGTLTNAVQFAHAKLAAIGDPEDVRLILILIDADEDLPCQKAPELLRIANEARSDARIACVLANIEFETWFVGAAPSLTEYLQLSSETVLREHPEQSRQGKNWIIERFKGVPYKETVDQPKLTAKMDLSLCRERCPSFDKLCRELEPLAWLIKMSEL